MANIGNEFSIFDEQSGPSGPLLDDSTRRSAQHRLETDKVSQGTFQDVDFLDFYQFDVVAGNAYRIVVTTDVLYGWNTLIQTSDFDIAVVDGALLPSVMFSSIDGVDAVTKEINFTAPETGQFYLQIDGSSGDFDYAVTISDLGVSSDPTAVNDLYHADFNTFLTFDSASGLLRNDSDPDTDPLTVTGTNYGGPGTLIVNPDGSFTYLPAPDFVGDDTFTYTISDGNGGSATGTATINVDPLPPFQLDVFDNKGKPMDGDMAFPGSVLAFRPTSSFPGQPAQFLSDLGPVELMARPTGTTDPFATIGIFAGDVNAIVVGNNLIGMDVLAQAENGAIFQTNIVPVEPPPFPPVFEQSFGGPLVTPDPLSPGGLIVDTNTVDDIAGFGSPPTFCVEVKYGEFDSLSIKTFTVDVTSLVAPTLNGSQISLQALNEVIQQKFNEVTTQDNYLIFEGFYGSILEDQTSYKYIEYRFVKKYLDGDGLEKTINSTAYQRLVVSGEDNTAEVAENVKVIDFTTTTPPPGDPANVIGTGGNGSDVLFGNGNANLLDGGSGDDVLISNGASDSLLGGAGDDDAIAGPGFTFFDGGPNTDTFHVDGNYFDFLLVSGSTDGGFFNLHVIDTRPGSPLSNSVLRNTEMIGFRNGVLNAETTEFSAFGGFAPNGTPVTSSTSHTGLVVDGMIFTDFESAPPPLELQQAEFFGQAALTESQNGVLEFNGSTYVIEPPFNAYLDLRENEGRIEVFVTDADYYNFAPPGTIDQSFSITITNAQGSNTYDFPFFIGRPDVAPVTDLGLSAVTVTENADAGTVIGAALLTFVDDPEVEEDFLLQISGTDAALFDFDEAGNLVVADGASIDFETQETANIIISATNLNGEVFEKAFEITVENMPISDITMISGGTVLEGAADDTVVATFESSENPVEPTAVLSIVSGADGLFYLDGNELKVAPNAGSVFDFDTQSNYFITFSATDGTGPAYEESFDIFVENVGPIVGTPDVDLLNGTQFDDEILALESDDTINASFGDDDIDGGPGTDTVVYSRNRNQVTHEWKDDGTIVVTRLVLGDGTDTMTNIERIDLNDGSLLYDVDTPNLGFGYRIYQASFDRTPDEGGVLFWIGVLDDLDNQGWSEYDKEQFLASQFIQSDEFKDLFGANPTNEEYIDAMYQNVLDRLPDQGGYDFWVGGMVNDGLTREDILIAFTKSDENVDRTAPDLDDGVWVV